MNLQGTKVKKTNSWLTEINYKLETLLDKPVHKTQAMLELLKDYRGQHSQQGQLKYMGTNQDQNSQLILGNQSKIEIRN